VPLNLAARGGRGDTARTLLIYRLLVADRDDMVVKAMSWALRELCRRDPQAVRDFLAEYKMGYILWAAISSIGRRSRTGDPQR
jgi:hypothetical protein